MNETNLSLSTSQKLQPFLLLSKSVKGVANSKLIMDALSAPGVYVFTELYQSPNLVEVYTSTACSWPIQPTNRLNAGIYFSRGSTLLQITGNLSVRHF